MIKLIQKVHFDGGNEFCDLIELEIQIKKLNIFIGFLVDQRHSILFPFPILISFYFISFPFYFKMFLQIFLLFLLYFPLQIFNPSFCADFDDEDKKKVVAEKLAELAKLTFDHSPNFFFSNYHIGDGTDYYGAYFVDGMTFGAFHEAIAHPNIDIYFGKNEKTGNLECTYFVWNWEWSSKSPDEYKKQIIKERDASGIDASKKRIYVDRIDIAQPQVSKDYFRTIPLFFTPPGIAPPANRVEIAEFFNSMNVHNILRICSAAYFYRGYSPDKEKISSRFMRDDWFLYLLEGKLECNLDFEEGENANQNGDELLAKGFEVLLYEMNGQMYNDLIEGNENPSDCAFEALLSKYSQEKVAENDIPEEGFIFHLAGIFGSAQLDNKEKSFWKWKKTGTKDGRDIYVVDDRWDKCTKNYGHFEALRIEFHHKCTKGKEGEKLICSIKKLDIKINFGIFDYKEFLNETVKAQVDLANQKLIMPDGKQFECVRKKLKGNSKGKIDGKGKIQ